MKAWQYITAGEPVSLQEVAAPVAGPGEVVVKVRAAGICHSDVTLIDSPSWPPAPIQPSPLTPGHESAGEIVALGEGVQGFAVGDRVGICPTTPAGSPGLMYNGGFAELVAVPAQTLVPIPDGVSFAQGAAATDAGMTSYFAVMTAGGVKAGDTVGVIGIGGLGQIGLRVAVLAGATVYAATRKPAAQEVARSLGVTDVRSSISDFPDVAFDVVVDFAGFDTTIDAAINAIRPGGTVVLVGVGEGTGTSTINSYSLIGKAATLRGSVGGTRDDIESLYGHMASGGLAPEITQIGFDEIGGGIERLRDGKVTGRLVAVFGED